MKSIIYIGMDAGGSKISAVGLRDGTRVAAELPSENARKESAQVTATRISELMSEVVAQLTAVGPPNQVVICAGIAGASSPSLQQAIQSHLAGLTGVSSNHITIVNDARIAFEAAFSGETNVNATTAQAPVLPKILVIAGTGSGCYSFSSTEEFFRAGGWGSVLGDPGSGTALGLAAIRSLLEGIELKKESGVADRVLTALEPAWHDLSGSKTTLKTVSSVLQLVYSPHFKPSILAPAILECCKEDGAARVILQSETAQLATQVHRLATRLSTEEKPLRVALTGGLVKNEFYRVELTNAIKRMIPHAEVQVSSKEPVEGALLLAQKRGNVKS